MSGVVYQEKRVWYLCRVVGVLRVLCSPNRDGVVVLGIRGIVEL
jgi:hypothetical protein